MLTGRRAFQKGTSAETITAILNEDPPEVPESGARISPALDRVVRHCLEKSPASRFQSARDLAFALDSLSTSSDPAGATASVGRATGRRSRAGERLALAAAGALLAGVALLFLMPGRGRVAAPAPDNPIHHSSAKGRHPRRHAGAFPRRPPDCLRRDGLRWPGPHLDPGPRRARIAAARRDKRGGLPFLVARRPLARLLRPGKAQEDRRSRRVSAGPLRCLLSAGRVLGLARHDHLLAVHRG